jgi:hypothetical protein
MVPNQSGVLLLPFGLRREGISDFHIRLVSPRNAPIGRSGLCPPSVIGEKGLIRQEYFQSFIKRIVKILWAIIAIPIKGGLQGLSAQVDWAERFPL